MTTPRADWPDSTTTMLRRALLLILLIGLVGTDVELLLLKHTDGFWQWIPVLLVGGAFSVVIWCAVRPSVASLRTLQTLMALFLIAGAVGVIQHFLGNIAYEKESNPSLAGVELYKSATMGATPLLAPGTMLQLGLVGLLFAFRHPALVSRDEAHSPPNRTHV